MKILIAPDSFKGSLTARQAADAMAAGVRRVRPQAELALCPLADGGEGSAEALVTATDGRWLQRRVTGPLGDPVDAAFGMLGSENTAIVEMAAASGLTLVPLTRRDPRITTSYGTGELLLAAVEAGAERIIAGLGGSATNDGGAGALQALGVRFLDASGMALPSPLGGADLIKIMRIDTAPMRFPVGDVPVTIASDVTNPLTGLEGASVVYGPQKGADSAAATELDAALAHYAAVIERDLGVSVASVPGGGAAGGLGAGLIAFLNATVVSGIDLILDAAGFEQKARDADWVLTGEGRIDLQTISGKTISGVLKRCCHLSIPVLAFGGSIDPEAEAALRRLGLYAAYPIAPAGMPLADAITNAAMLLETAAAEAIKLQTPPRFGFIS